jgi:hypothetical protein
MTVHRVELTFLLAFFALIGFSLALQEDQPSVPGVKVTVPFELLPSNHMVVRAKINGKGPYQLIFDLGAPITLLNSRVAEESGTIQADAPRSFLFNVRGEAEAKELQLGDLKAKNLPMIVMDHPALKVIGQVFKRPIDGIVGYTFFARYKTTIDYQALKMTFEPVKFEVRNLMKDLPDRLLGARTAQQRILAPASFWGLKVGESPNNPMALGVPVLEVFSGSPAATAGLKTGDILISIDGRWTTSVADTYAATAVVPAGQTVPVILQRGEKELMLLVKPGAGA